MKTVKRTLLEKLAACGKYAAIKAAGAASCAGLHQPKEPAALKNFKKK